MVKTIKRKKKYLQVVYVILNKKLFSPDSHGWHSYSFASWYENIMKDSLMQWL